MSDPPPASEPPSAAAAPTADAAPPANAVTAAAWLAPLVRRGFQLVALLALAVLTMRVIAMFQLGTIWDDAYIFQRYSRNLLDGHGWAFNPGGEATYGTTSLLFLLPGTLLRAITDNTSLSAILSSVSGGVLFIAVAALSLRRAEGSNGTRAATLLMLLLWAATSEFAHHFASGMDTTWVLAYLAVYWWQLNRLRQLPSRRRAMVVGLVGALSFAVRPDLLVFTVGVVALWWMLDRKARAFLSVAIAITLAGTALQLGVNAWYFGNPLPLPFYAKSLGLYGGSLKRAYRAVSTEYLAQFLAAAWPLLAVVTLDVLVSPRRWWRQSHPQEKATLAAMLVFGVYYWVLALPVMGFHQRFYQPMMVPLMWLTAYALARWQRQYAAAQSTSITAAPGQAVTTQLAAAAGLAMAMFWLWPLVATQGAASAKAVLRRGLDFDVYGHAKRKGPQSYWYKMYKVSQLPDDLVIAATEVGMLGAVNPKKRIVDIAGLNERVFALSAFDAERLLNEYRPDLIYMPHRDYTEMRKALTSSPAFDNYVLFDMKRLRTKAFGVALRKDSPHFAQMSKLLPSSKKSRPNLRGMSLPRGR